MRTLLIGDIHPEAEKLLRQNTQLTKIKREDFPEFTDSKNNDKKIESIVLRTFTQLTAKELDKFTVLRYVVSCSTGLNNLDLDEIKKRNIQLIHFPGANANGVAEHILFFILSLMRKISDDEFIELKGKTIGIIGFGAIGKLVAKKLLGFEADVIAFDVIEQDQKLIDELSVTMKSFDEVVRESDILTVQVPLNKYTQHLINADVFTKMKQGSSFVSIARPEVADENTLLNYYNSGKFKAIALDDCTEKLDQIKGQKNVLITNHIAGKGDNSFREMCLQPVKKLIELI